MAENILRCQCTDLSNVEMWFFNYYFPFVFPNILECIYILVKVTQLCPTLCDPLDCTVHGIFQARILEWVTFPFSRGSSQSRDQTQVSCIAGGFFTNWATREAHLGIKIKSLKFFLFTALKVKVLVAQSCSTLCTSWPVICQASLSMEFFKQEYWCGLPFPSPGDRADPGI